MEILGNDLESASVLPENRDGSPHSQGRGLKGRSRKIGRPNPLRKDAKQTCCRSVERSFAL